MIGRNLLLFWLGLFSCTGCLHRHADISLLENELRWMEDQLFTMEEELQRKQRQLATCQAASRCDEIGAYSVIQDYAVGDGCSASAMSPGSSSRYEVVPPSESMPTLRSTPKSTGEEPTPADRSNQSSPKYEILNENGAPRFAPDRSTTEPPAELDLNIEELEPRSGEPRSDLDMLSPPDVELPPDNTTRAIPGRIRLSSYEDGAEIKTTTVDAHVTHIVVKAWLAHGHGFDSLERDVDLLVCVEPRSADGHAVPLGAELSLVVLDATKSGEEARVARWDYSAAEARRLLRQSDAGHGIHLELPWPDEVSSTADLHIFARYLTVEDLRLEADARVQDSFRGPESVQRAGWRRVEHRHAATRDSVDADKSLARVRSKIKLHPIPHQGGGTSDKPNPNAPDQREDDRSRGIPRGEEQPTILSDERDPSWRPER